MAQVILNVAMGYVRQNQPIIEDEGAMGMISNLFERLIAGEDVNEQLSQLLQATIGNNQPLIKIQNVLSCGETPLQPSWSSNDGNEATIRKKTHPWSPTEDARLLGGILRYGLENWVAISKFVGNGRTRAQCAQRWSRGLDPRISKEQWTPEEEELLIRLITESGNKNWTAIAASMGSRSDVQCRYHFLQMQRDGKIKNDTLPSKSGIPLPNMKPKLSQRLKQGSPPAIIPKPYGFNSNPIRQNSVPRFTGFMPIPPQPPQGVNYLSRQVAQMHSPINIPPIPQRPRRHSASATQAPSFEVRPPLEEAGLFNNSPSNSSIDPFATFNNASTPDLLSPNLFSGFDDDATIDWTKESSHDWNDFNTDW